MKFSDEANTVTTPSADYGSRMAGILTKTPDADYGGKMKFGVFIPKLMMLIDASQGAKETTKTVGRSKIKNAKNKSIGGTSFVTRTYVELPPLVIGNMTLPKFVKGEQVFLEMFDHDIKTLAVLPYSVYTVNNRVDDVWAIFVPARKDSQDKSELGEGNSWLMKFDTKNKIFTLHMSDASGNLLPFTIQYKQKDKLFQITDSERTLKWAGKDDQLIYKNKAETTFDIKGDKVSVKAKHIEMEGTTDIKFKTPKMEIKADNFKQESKTAEYKLDDAKFEGKHIKTKFTSHEAEGTTYAAKFNSCDYDDKTHKVGGKLVPADGIYFTGDRMIPPIPLKPHITSDGVAMHDSMGLMSFPLVKWMPLISLLAQIAAKADAVGQIHGMPMSAASAVASSAMDLASQRSKG